MIYDNYYTISVPHGFNNDQRSAVIAAANEAGIKDVYIIKLYQNKEIKKIINNIIKLSF